MTTFRCSCAVYRLGSQSSQRRRAVQQGKMITPGSHLLDVTCLATEEKQEKKYG
jgi:hypothetical protein